MQIIVIIKYWTVLAVLAITISLLSYFIITQSNQTYAFFRLSPKAFPFLCEPPLVSLGKRDGWMEDLGRWPESECTQSFHQPQAGRVRA